MNRALFLCSTKELYHTIPLAKKKKESTKERKRKGYIKRKKEIYKERKKKINDC